MPEGPRPFRVHPIPRPTAKPRVSPRLRALSCRLSPSRAGGPDGAADRGLVVQAVLLTVMVTAIGLLAVASRVASSREGAAASSLAAAARQAAEFGFSEIVAEMNRDAKAYLWVTPYANWQSVSDADLRACGIHASTAPSANPIPGASNGTTTSVSLPGSSDLSYQLIDYQAPASLGTASSCTTFANRRGGTATLTVVGRAQRPSGDQTTYTLKRSVSVRRAEPVFRNTLFTAPASQALVTSSDARFPAFPTTAGLGGAALPVPGPALACAPGGGGGSATYQCGSETFDNSRATKFPFTSSGALASFCSQTAGSIVCQLASLSLNNVELIVSVQAAPVNLMLAGDLVIPSNAALCSDSSGSTAVTSCSGSGSGAPTGSWSRLRLFGKASGASCDQQVQLNGSTAINLRNAFLWFPYGSLTYPAALTSLPAGLVGWVCSVAAPAATTTVASLPPNQVFDGLADPSNGIFTGAANQPGTIRFLYRGFGSQEQLLQP